MTAAFMIFIVDGLVILAGFSILAFLFGLVDLYIWLLRKVHERTSKV
jgi:hypothetical protein